MVGLDLLRQHADVAVFDAELFVAGAVLGVVRPHLLVAERFELLERFIERHSRNSPGYSLARAKSSLLRRTSSAPCASIWSIHRDHKNAPHVGNRFQCSLLQTEFEAVR